MPSLPSNTPNGANRECNKIGNFPQQGCQEHLLHETSPSQPHERLVLQVLNDALVIIDMDEEGFFFFSTDASRRLSFANGVDLIWTTHCFRRTSKGLGGSIVASWK
jgi:hypothetical protein